MKRYWRSVLVVLAVLGAACSPAAPAPSPTAASASPAAAAAPAAAPAAGPVVTPGSPQANRAEWERLKEVARREGKV